jgi:hypothetical protein
LFSSRSSESGVGRQFPNYSTETFFVFFVAFAAAWNVKKCIDLRRRRGVRPFGMWWTIKYFFNVIV